MRCRHQALRGPGSWGPIRSILVPYRWAAVSSNSLIVSARFRPEPSAPSRPTAFWAAAWVSS
ncbi:hypothetical protein GCM10027176_38320 [Actinoallomurus bryophytorum]